jgi:hypothetical protein
MSYETTGNRSIQWSNTARVIAAVHFVDNRYSHGCFLFMGRARTLASMDDFQCYIYIYIYIDVDRYLSPIHEFG